MVCVCQVHVLPPSDLAFVPEQVEVQIGEELELPLMASVILNKSELTLALHKLQLYLSIAIVFFSFYLT